MKGKKEKNTLRKVRQKKKVSQKEPTDIYTTFNVTQHTQLGKKNDIICEAKKVNIT